MKTGLKFVNPGSERIFRTDYKDPGDNTFFPKVSVHPQYRSGFSGTGNGKIGTALHGTQEKGIPHLPLAQFPGHSSIYYLTIPAELLCQFRIVAFELYAQTGAGINEELPFRDIILK